MPQLSRVEEVGSNYVLTTFEKLPSVQTYLVAFIIFDFDYVEDLTGEIPHRVFASPQAILDGEAALAIEVSGLILSTFEEYLGVNYTLPKMDQSVIPNFSSGAMENWGLVTYRESLLLYNQVTSTTRDRENVISTIAHEFTVSRVFFSRALVNRL